MHDHLRLSIGDQLDLKWYFSYGITRIERSTIGPQLDSMRAKIVGNGCSVHLAVEPDEGEVLRAGSISRILANLSTQQSLVLALAHGDAGYVATDGGRLPERRWRAVAHLTKTAIAQGHKHRKEFDYGDAARLWLERNWSRGAKVTKEINRAEKEARALIDDAELAYAGVAGPKREAEKQRQRAVRIAVEDRALEGVR